MISLKKMLVLLCLAGLGISIALAQSIDERGLSPFSAIKSTASLDVILTQGTREEVRIEAKNVDTDKIITEVNNGTLTISMKKGNYWNMNAKVYVTFRELESVYLSGSGDVQCNSGISADAFEVTLSGSGDINLENLNAPSVKVRLSGSGDIALDGRTDYLNVELRGSGDISAFDLEARDVRVSLAGSGDVNVHASEEIEANVNGSGDIQYKGNPESRKVNISGSGDVDSVN